MVFGDEQKEIISFEEKLYGLETSIRKFNEMYLHVVCMD